MNYYINAFRNYFVFADRARRKEYGYFLLFNFLVAFIISIIDYVISGKTDGILSSIYSLIVFVPSVSILVRRAHDFGKSTSFVFGILGLIIAFMLIGIGTLVFQSGLEFGAMSVIIGTVISVGFYYMHYLKKVMSAKMNTEMIRRKTNKIKAQI